jgi:hypothetical protein
MRKTHCLALEASLVASLFVCAVASATPPQPQSPAQQQQGARHVDLVIALDTSSSMDGLIDSARGKLWDVVNLLAQARPQPILRVGLISYGNDGYDARGGWVRKESDLTGDLDSVYAKLFKLSTNGGNEYVARAVKVATGDMRWSDDPKALRIIFVAGNEPANQDPQVAVETAVQQAREKGIFVNAIYCGSDGNSEAIGWRGVAKMGAGRFAAIDQNNVVAIATPEDDNLARLSDALNKTYVAYGAGGAAHAENQAAQDKNAASAGAPAAASRAVAKSSVLYEASDWDLVDAKKKGKKDVAAMPAAELPAPMRALKPADRQAYLDGKAHEREEIQKQIAAASARRDQFLQAERTRRAKGSTKALDDALGDTIRTEATSAGFSF